MDHSSWRLKTKVLKIVCPRSNLVLTEEETLLRRNHRDFGQTAEPFNEQKTSLVRFSYENSATTECSPESSATLSRAPSGSSEAPLPVMVENSETSLRVTGKDVILEEVRSLNTPAHRA
ncbi:hypothetical protein MRX96_043792 [Rhipicephalus microplus]